jgi:hypothetical protein
MQAERGETLTVQTLPHLFFGGHAARQSSGEGASRMWESRHSPGLSKQPYVVLEAMSASVPIAATAANRTPLCHTSVVEVGGVRSLGTPCNVRGLRARGFILAPGCKGESIKRGPRRQSDG